MSYAYMEITPGLHVREDAVLDLVAVDSLIFDVDGVLVDVTGSYPVVIAQVTQFYFERVLGWSPGPQLVRPEEVALFKQAGGFNSDWAVAQAAVLFYLWKAGRSGVRDLAALRAAAPSLEEFLSQVKAAGGGLEAVARLAPPAAPSPAPWDPALVQRLCEEHYGGDDWCREMFGFAPAYRTGRTGLFNDERPLIDPAELATWSGRAGIYTGRVDRETIPALKLCGLDHLLGGVIPEGAVVTASRGFRKPDPSGLVAAAEAMGARRAVYCGDNVDDWVTADNYRRRWGPLAGAGADRLSGAAKVGFAGILGGTLGAGAEAIFREKGAELIACDVNLVIRYLKGRQAEG